MIRNVVLHLNNEQPMLADLFDLPEAADVIVRCTNLRTLDGKRPVFVDDSAAVFCFPYQYVRFVEIPPAAAADTGLPMPVVVAAEKPAPVMESLEEADLEIDEDFLRRVREV